MFASHQRNTRQVKVIRRERQCIPDFDRFLEGGQNARKKVRVETFLKRERKGVLRHNSKMQSSGGVGGGPVASAPSTIGLKTSAHAVVQCLKGKIKQHIQRAEDGHEGDNINQHTPKWGKGGRGICSPRPQSLVGGGRV